MGRAVTNTSSLLWTFVLNPTRPSGSSTASFLLRPRCSSLLTRLVSGCVISSQSPQTAILRSLDQPARRQHRPLTGHYGFRGPPEIDDKYSRTAALRYGKSRMVVTPSVPQCLCPSVPRLRIHAATSDNRDGPLVGF